MCAIHQPHLYPNAGWFHKLVKSDVFVVLTLVDMNYRSYIHRCKLSTGSEALWGSLSVDKSAEIIGDVKLINDDPLKKSLKGIFGNAYSKSEFDFEINSKSMSEYNQTSVINVLKYYGLAEVEDRMITDHDLIMNNGESIEEYQNMPGSQKMAYLTRLAKCDKYYSGALGINYLDKKDFEGIELLYSTFKEVPYKQKQNTEFVPGCSVVDFIINKPELDFKNYIGL